MQIPVRINMGIDSPKDKNLGVRELYVYVNDDNPEDIRYELWVGGPNGEAHQLTVAKSNDTDETTIGDIFAITGTKLSGVDDEGVSKNIDINSVTLSNISKLTLSADNYGKTLPDRNSGVEGQIFFKI